MSSIDIPERRRRARSNQRGYRTAALLVAASAVAFSACSPIKPWVKPYEREHLSDPIMSLGRDPVSASYRDRLFESSEGAHGAAGDVTGNFGPD